MLVASAIASPWSSVARCGTKETSSTAMSLVKFVPVTPRNRTVTGLLPPDRGGPTQEGWAADVGGPEGGHDLKDSQPSGTVSSMTVPTGLFSASTWTTSGAYSSSSDSG